jgi:hypothetical protein
MRPKINPRLKVHHHIARSNVDDAYPAIGMHFHGVETLVELGNAELEHHRDSCPGRDNIASLPESSLVVLLQFYLPFLTPIFPRIFPIVDDRKILISQFHHLCDAEVTWNFIRAARVVAHQWWAPPHFVCNGVTTLIALTLLAHPTGSGEAELIATVTVHPWWGRRHICLLELLLLLSVTIILCAGPP